MVESITQNTGYEEVEWLNNARTTEHHFSKAGRRAVVTAFEPPARVATGRHA